MWPIKTSSYNTERRGQERVQGSRDRGRQSKRIEKSNKLCMKRSTEGAVFFFFLKPANF
jgi:hypothetical protein